MSAIELMAIGDGIRDALSLEQAIPDGRLTAVSGLDERRFRERLFFLVLQQANDQAEELQV